MTEALVDRLLAEAESRAARGERREAMLLLKWAATVAPRAAIPRVLLSFHRVRAPGDGEAAEVVPAPTGTDRAGFPLPRFATRPPKLDDGAPWPPPRSEPVGASFSTAGNDTAAHLRRPPGALWRFRALWLLAVPAVAASAAGPNRAAAGAAAVAIAIGRPAEALGVLDHVDRPDAHVLLLRGRALRRLGDAGSAEAALRAAAQRAVGDAVVTLATARELAEIPGCGAAAADVYLLALERGAPAAALPEIARQLDRAGRVEEARRVRRTPAPR